MRQLALCFGVFPFRAEYIDDPFVQASNAVEIVRKYLDDSDLVMVLGKHSKNVPRNNLCCLTRLHDLIELNQTSK